MSSSAEALARSRRVLRGGHNAALATADPVSAHSTARLLLGTDAPPDPAAAIADAHAAGYAEGHAAGLADALAEAERARAAVISHAADVLTACATESAADRAQLVEQALAEALELTYELLASILGEETVARAVPPRDAVARAIALAPRDEDLIVRLAPGFPLDREELAAIVDPARVSIRHDPSVEIGGCIVEAGPCHIDAQISTALARVRELLVSKAAGDDDEDEEQG